MLRGGRWMAAALVVLAACSAPASDADPELQDQYLQVARTAGARAGIHIPDADWLRIADTVCDRRFLSDADYQELLDEIERDAPDPDRGRVMQDVARTAISLFCPP